MTDRTVWEINEDLYAAMTEPPEGDEALEADQDYQAWLSERKATTLAHQIENTL